jgi:arylsulfatase A-like enzyme
MSKKLLLVFITFFITFLIFFNLPKNDFSCRDCNVILISVDSLRKDHIGIYGYEKNTTPNIDKFAKKSLVFTNAVGQSSWTLPSHISIFTSLYPSSHGVPYIGYQLNKNITMFHEFLKSQNYTSIAIINNVYLSSIFGFNRSFDFFNEQFANYTKNGKTITDVNKHFFDWLNKNHQKKFFAFIQYIDSHCPYIAHEKYFTNYQQEHEKYKYLEKKCASSLKNYTPTKDEIQFMKKAYDSDIAFVDENLNELFKKLEVLGIINKTIIILTSDHGDQFMEHGGLEHAYTLYDEVISVPLIIWHPKLNTKIINTQVQLIDIMPTILDFLGLSIPNNIDGKSLIAVISGNSNKETPAFSEKPPYKIISVRFNDFKFILTNNTNRELYDLKNDPNEKENVTKKYPGIANQLERMILEYKIETTKKANMFNGSIFKEIGELNLDPAVREKLRELGYVN